MKALSILQPWAWLIANGYKQHENRTWDTKFRGEFLIHAGKGFDAEGYAWVRENFTEIPLPPKADFERGGIVGRATLFNVAKASSSPWFFGPFGFCIASAVPLPFTPCRGMLGFFEVAMPLPGVAA